MFDKVEVDVEEEEGAVEDVDAEEDEDKVIFRFFEGRDKKGKLLSLLQLIRSNIY